MADQGDKNVAGMENIITMPGQPPVTHFVSGIDECEKKTVVWDIQNFSELLQMSDGEMKKNGITFDAGHSIGIPATWYFYFTRLGSATGCFAILKLDTDSKAKHVTAGYSISLSCGRATIGGSEIYSEDFKTDPETETETSEEFDVGLAWLISKDSDVLELTDNGKKTLKVTLVVSVFSNKDSVMTPKARLLTKAAVISDFEKLLESGDGADVEITVPSEVGGQMDASAQTKQVHKAILMARSPVFSTMFAKESEMVEAKTGKVFIKDLSPQGLGVFLHYIYNGKSSVTNQKADLTHEMIWHDKDVLKESVKVPLEILNCAEKYDLGILKQYCGENLMSAVTTGNAVALYRATKLHNLPLAKRAVAKFISKNTEAALDADDDCNSAENTGEKKDDDGSE